MTTPNVANPNDVGFDVILQCGQSNNYNGHYFDANLDTIDSRVWQWPQQGAYANANPIPAQDPLLNVIQNGPSPAAISYVTTFAKLWARTRPPHRQVLIVPMAQDSTGFTTTSATTPPAGYTNNGSAGYTNNGSGGSWDPGQGDGGINLYANSIVAANAAIASGPNNRLVAILWHQGESDSGPLNQATYAAKIDALIAGFRANITGAATVPFILGTMLDYWVQNVNTSAPSINLAHIDTPRRNYLTALAVGPSAIVSISNPSGAANQNGDNLHYSASAQRAFGVTYFAAYQRALLNLPATGSISGGTATGAGIAPAVPGAPTLVQSTTSLTVTWPQASSRVTGYQIRWQQAGGAWTTITQATNLANATTITGLTEGNTYNVQVATINEQGTSTWGAQSSITLVSPAAQVTGLAAGTSTTFQQPLSWTPVAGAVSYTVQYKAHSSGAWLTAATGVTGSSYTVSSGLSSGTSYDYQVAAVNAGGTGTYSSTVTNSTVAFTPLLTSVGVTAFRAYGLRLLNGSYNGNLVLVRRDSDNTTQAIGTDGAGNLSQTALLAFVGSANGFIVTWYDQSGSGYDITQATAANQAQIVAAGVVNKNSNGNLQAIFNGTSDFYADTTAGHLGLYAAGSCSVQAVFTNTGSATAYLVDESVATSNVYAPVFVSSTKHTSALAQNNVPTTLLNSAGTVAMSSTASTQVSAVGTGTSYQNWNNGTTSAGPTSYTRSGTVNTPTSFTIGALGGAANSPMAMGLSEIVVWEAALNTTQRQAGEANSNSYYGT